MKNSYLIRSFLIIFLICNTSILNAQDWANLQYYQVENEMTELPKEGENRVVFMGNSITQGWKKTHPDFFSENPFICRGISGQTTPQMLLRFRQDVVELQPKLVVILAGTNDIAGNTGFSTLEMIMDNLASMAEIAQANHIKVILCSVLPAYDYPWKPGLEPAEKIVSLNKMIKSYCEEKAFMYLDYHTAMADAKNGMKSELTNDGVHVTSEGYILMEKMLLEAIQKLLKCTER